MGTEQIELTLISIGLGGSSELSSGAEEVVIL